MDADGRQEDPGRKGEQQTAVEKEMRSGSRQQGEQERGRAPDGEHVTYLLRRPATSARAAAANITAVRAGDRTSR